jgi:hypothetical protein
METGPGPEAGRLNYANLAPRHNVLKGISKISKPDPITHVAEAAAMYRAKRVGTKRT